MNYINTRSYLSSIIYQFGGDVEITDFSYENIEKIVISFLSEAAHEDVSDAIILDRHLARMMSNFLSNPDAFMGKIHEELVEHIYGNIKTQVEFWLGMEKIQYQQDKKHMYGVDDDFDYDETINRRYNGFGGGMRGISG